MENLHRQFLNDIIKDKKDDGIRLIYADYLDDVGEHLRAEFIRLQIENTNKDRIKEIIRGYDEVTKEQLGYKWAKVISDISNASWIFNRGFIDKIHISPKIWSEKYEELVTNHPLEQIEILSINVELLSLGDSMNYLGSIGYKTKIYLVDNPRPSWESLLRERSGETLYSLD